MNDAARPAMGLIGTTLPTGWTLEGEIPPYEGRTGATFCVGYIANRNGERAFIKVIDLMNAAHNRTNLVESLHEATSEILAERAVLALCHDKKMTRIIRLIDHGEYEVPAFAGDPLGRVHYFVFELAASDVRKEVSFAKNDQILWKLRVLKDVALAIDQLHRGGVAHQDIKPSNVLLMKPAEDAGDHKLGDLGRAIRMNASGPFDDHVFPGDARYAPLSAWYGVRDAEWVDGRTSADLYMLGVLACFLFGGINITQRQMVLIPNEMKVPDWHGTFEAVLPFLINVHAQVMEEIEQGLPDSFRADLFAVIKELTHPDPRLRGNPRARARVGRPPGTETYVSRFAHLVKVAELKKSS
ncbi:MAG: hypothetical protein HY661_07455 [Betaproteobacteria bacterium]|nr:hypothetical protein [Betaproteobacteria bacterium]